MRRKYLNRVTESDFINWYFSDSDDLTEFAKGIIDKLAETGKCNLTVKKVFDNCGYIPSHICESKLDEEEYQPHEVRLVKDISN